MGWLRVTAVNVALLGALVLAGDFLITWWKPPPSNPDKEFRIEDPLYSHTLKPNYSTDRAIWGSAQFPLRTNSLGFRDASVRTVSARPQGKRRLVIIGDSFTEGIGLAWEDSFVGRFARLAPQLEVLNAGVLSYAPSVYYRKTAWLLDSGYSFDELLVYIDVSDIQDEAIAYREGPNNTILYVGYGINYWATVANPVLTDPSWKAPDAAKAGDGAASPPMDWKSWMKARFAYSNLAYSMLKMKLRRQEAPPKMLRSYWTVDAGIPGYGEMGVEGALRKASTYMDRLAELLRSRGIALSVAIYPWPDQLEFDSEEHRHATHWKAWCERGGCARFIDHSPDFFAFKNAHPDWRRRLFISGDVHHSPEATELIAQRLARAYNGK
jgi:hypothetical protein